MYFKPLPTVAPLVLALERFFRCAFTPSFPLIAIVQIFFLLDDERVGRKYRKSKGIKVPGTGAIFIQPVNAALLVVLQSIPAASASSSFQGLSHVNKAIDYFCRL
jgi:hypothetical protein